MLRLNCIAAANSSKTSERVIPSPHTFYGLLDSLVCVFHLVFHGAWEIEQTPDDSVIWFSSRVPVGSFLRSGLSGLSEKV